MSTFLHKKPFYFLTDRQTKYTSLVTPSKTYVYHPDSFETLSASKVHRKKVSLIAKLLFWATTHPKSMLPNDYRTCVSRVIDMTGMLFLALLGARVLKRFASRIEVPFVENALKDRLITLDTIKSFTANSTMLFLTYKYWANILNEDYLYDLALEYRRNYDKKGYYLSSNCKQELDELQKLRFEGK